MSFIPARASGPEEDRESASLVLDIREEAERHAWAQAARWRAGALALEVFGPGVIPRLRYARSAAGFHALVELEVPFHDLELHRELEDDFLLAADSDDVLSRIPTVYLFAPGQDPAVETGREMKAAG